MCVKNMEFKQNSEIDIMRGNCIKSKTKGRPHKINKID